MAVRKAAFGRCGGLPPRENPGRRVLNRLHHVLRLPLEAFRRSGRLLHQRGVLLGDLIHLADRLPHLDEATDFFATGMADLGHDFRHPLDGGHDLGHGSPGHSVLADDQATIGDRPAETHLRPLATRPLPALPRMHRPAAGRFERQSGSATHLPRWNRQVRHALGPRGLPWL